MLNRHLSIIVASAVFLLGSSQAFAATEQVVDETDAPSYSQEIVVTPYTTPTFTSDEDADISESAYTAPQAQNNSARQPALSFHDVNLY